MPRQRLKPPASSMTADRAPLCSSHPISRPHTPLVALLIGRVRRSAVLLLVVVAAAACARSSGSRSVTHTSMAPEPETAAALLRVATTFNNDFGNNNDAPVYARWDARSQKIISEAEFVRRHQECATATQTPAHVQTASPGPDGAWLVRYSIGGQEFTDYWYYQHGRWLFDLILSNPDAVQLYRLSGPAYGRAVGCSH